MPAAVGFASGHMDLGIAMGSFAIGSYAIGFIAALCLPDATGVDLEAIDSGATRNASAVEAFVARPGHQH